MARFLAAALLPRPDEIATIGDMPNDILMFAHSGLSIAMGNADPEVKRAARRVTDEQRRRGLRPRRRPLRPDRFDRCRAAARVPRPRGGSRSGRTA